ncbi:hypothetical protein BDA99DRAFT_567782 [Phascolomyces articulosus]|uniref:Wax synthase domain-containing protein n=1 Tax=Phascolomyces articulosus TaxID=60185 RepID=A0AAD5PL84_9FUNG|nr:hypothetical protein BDA99DRAFT_567782 [Phascolomyces articulosus]
MESIIETFYQAGSGRTHIPFPFIFPIFTIPSGLLAILLITNKVPTTAKQVLSIPLLAIIFTTPIFFTSSHGVVDIIVAPACYNLFLRLFEFFWISPLLYGKQAYATRDYLYHEFWASICRFPKSNKKKDDDAKPKEYVKDKKMYHLFMYLAYHLFIIDVFGSWFATFTGNEVINMHNDRPALLFLFNFLVVYTLTSAFNVVGYSLQVAHCIYYELGGGYSSEQWRPLMINPVLSTSLEELWSVRWHQLFHTSWVAFGFRPARYITQRALAKTVKNTLPISLLAGTLAVFFVSGLTHEYMVYANNGWSVYKRLFIGQQVLFFFTHGLGMSFERIVKKFAKAYLPPSLLESILVRHIISRIWVFSFAYLTFPFFMDGFAYGQLWFDNPLSFSRPYVFEFFRSVAPSVGKAVCGSLL